jgi:hypothetical protein
MKERISGACGIDTDRLLKEREYDSTKMRDGKALFVGGSSDAH